jgi:hypothetical protein
VLSALSVVPPLPPSALPFLDADEPGLERDDVEGIAPQFLNPHEELLNTFRKQAKLLREVEDEVDIRMHPFFYNIFFIVITYVVFLFIYKHKKYEYFVHNYIT